MSAAGGITPHTPPPDWRQEFEAELLPLLQRTEAPGVGVTLFSANEVLLEAGYGLRDVARGLPVTPGTIFGVASITKSFTALSVQLLAAEGLLSLNDPVTDYLPFTLWEGREPARLRHFLDHTSGLAPTPTMTWLRVASQANDPVAGGASLSEALSTVAGGADELASRAAQVGTFEGLVEWLNANADLLGEPGAVFSYSNDAFCLMGAVFEAVSRMRFDDFVQHRILSPLGMQRTTFELADVLADPDHTTIYERAANGSVAPSPAWQTTGRMLGGGMLKSTLADLRTWVRALMAPATVAADADVTPAAALGLEPERVQQMAWGSGHPLGLLSTDSYGLGLRTRAGYAAGRLAFAPAGLSVVGHGGSLKGVSSQIAWAPELGVGVVVLSNLAGLPSERMAVMALNAYAGLPVTGTTYDPAPLSLAPADEAAALHGLLGEYASGEPYGRLSLYVDEGGQLQAAVGAPPEVVPAYLVGPNEVAIRYAEHSAPALFLRREDGAVWAAHVGSRVLRRVG
ncbi:MAG: serine hydrolase domain-containing protein [Trueperaceae bacterium]